MGRTTRAERETEQLLHLAGLRDELRKITAERDQLRATVAGLRRALETAVDEVQTIAYGKEGDVKNDFTSGESHGWGMAYLHLCGIVGPALAASPDDHARRIKAEALDGAWKSIAALETVPAEDLRDRHINEGIRQALDVVFELRQIHYDAIEKEATDGR